MSEAPQKELIRLKDRLEALCVEMLDRGIEFGEALDQFEKTFIIEMVKRNGGNMIRASAALGIHRNTLSKRLIQYKAKKR
jgi:DNA-binding NtrC family response regulator